MKELYLEMILKFLIASAQFYPTQKEDKDWETSMRKDVVFDIIRYDIIDGEIIWDIFIE